MAILPLTQFPLAALRRAADAVSDATAPFIGALVRDLRETMLAANGIGLAAPQVGVALRVIVVKTDDGWLGLINPVIVESSHRWESGEEGCLSIPGVFGLVRRSFRIRVTARSPVGEPVRFATEGLLARVLQHEVDHLNGILFIDRLDRFTAGNDRLRELWRAVEPRG